MRIEVSLAHHCHCRVPVCLAIILIDGRKTYSFPARFDPISVFCQQVHRDLHGNPSQSLRFITARATRVHEASVILPSLHLSSRWEQCRIKPSDVFKFPLYVHFYSFCPSIILCLFPTISCLCLVIPQELTIKEQCHYMNLIVLHISVYLHFSKSFISTHTFTL